MKPLYSVTLTSGFYSNQDRPAAIHGNYTDVHSAIAAVSQAATRYFAQVGGEWGGATITSDTGVTLTLDHEMRHPVWIISRQVEVEWLQEVALMEKETVTVDGAEYSREVLRKQNRITKGLQMFAARIRLSGYILDDLRDVARSDNDMDECAEAIADAAWDAMKKETP